jgi:hypothetical protein
VIDDESLVKTRTNICFSYASAVPSYSVLLLFLARLCAWGTWLMRSRQGDKGQRAIRTDRPLQPQMIDNTRWITQPKLLSAIFYEHALAAILAVSVIHAMKREQSPILAVSAILAVSVARVIWRDSLAKIVDTKIIGIDTQWFIWYNLSSVLQRAISTTSTLLKQKKPGQLW